MRNIGIVIVALSVGLAGCKKSSNTSSTYTPTCTGTKSFKNDVFPLIQSACNSCHANLSNYAQVSSLASSIRSTIVSGSMPKNSTLSNSQKDVIVCWIDAGFPNN